MPTRESNTDPIDEPVQGSTITTVISIRVFLAAFVTIFLIGGALYFQQRAALILSSQQEVLRLAKTISLFLDGDLHAQIKSSDQVNSSSFLQLRQVLDRVRVTTGISEDHIYTFYQENGQIKFSVMTQSVPFPGKEYPIAPPALKNVFETASSTVSELYENNQGTWISAYAPIKNQSGKVTGVLALDVPQTEILKALRNSMLYMLGGFILAGFMIAVLAGAMISRKVAQPLRELIIATKRLSEGNFTEGILLDSQNELGRLAVNFNKMIDNMNRIMQQNFDATSQIYSASKEISSTIEEQVAGIAQQSSAINQTTTTLQEIKTISEQTTEKSEEVVHAAEHAMKVSHQGQNAVNNSIDKMNMIRERVERIADHISNLSTQSKQISVIVGAVNDLAERTNLIALNAAIEASKAGTAGKGFGVVAQEVRRLAEQSRQASEKIAVMLSEIQKMTEISVSASVEGIKGVDQGMEQIKSAGEQTEISMQAMQSNVDAAQQIFAASKQQAIGIEQILSAMTSINQVMKQISAGAKHSHSITTKLDQLANELNSMVKKFKLQAET